MGVGAGRDARVSRGVVSLLALGTMTGCSAMNTGGSASTAAPSRSAVAAPNTAARASSSGQYQVVSEPGAGYGWCVHQLKAARRTVDVWMYELTDRDVIAALVAAHDRGVAVRVIGA